MQLLESLCLAYIQRETFSWKIVMISKRIWGDPLFLLYSNLGTFNDHCNWKSYIIEHSIFKNHHFKYISEFAKRDGFWKVQSKMKARTQWLSEYQIWLLPPGFLLNPRYSTSMTTLSLGPTVSGDFSLDSCINLDYKGGQ